MNLDNLNKWLTLTANLGVLVGIFVVAVELQQSQSALLAESSSTRTQMVSEINSIGIDRGINQIRSKFLAGKEISEQDLGGANEWVTRMLRHLENMHYQYQIGVLDDEIWEVTRRGVKLMADEPLFHMVFPNWPNEFMTQIYRESFIELLASQMNLE
jgi:hypothetical protein